MSAARVEGPVLSELQEGFRDAMGNVAAAVSVVTTLSGPSGDRPHGATVSAFASLSMDPPMLLVSLQETSRLLALLTPGSHLGVNVLAAHQRDLALRFASRREDRFGDLDWVPRDGSPALAGAHAWVGTRVARLVPAGDHTLVLADVLAASCGEPTPLTYWRRTFGTHRAH